MARVAAVVLAAGSSRRMGEVNKLLIPINGAPMVARAVDAALVSRAEPVVVVTGHQHDLVERALGNRAITLVHNDRFVTGMASSLQKGIAALPPDIDGVVVCLGDMPDITGAHVDRLIDAFAPERESDIVVPMHQGRRGNPVLWGRRYFPEILALSGDEGARSLLARHSDRVAAVLFDDAAIFGDIDRPEDLPA